MVLVVVAWLGRGVSHYYDHDFDHHHLFISSIVCVLSELVSLVCHSSPTNQRELRLALVWRKLEGACSIRMDASLRWPGERHASSSYWGRSRCRCRWRWRWRCFGRRSASYEIVHHQERPAALGSRERRYAPPSLPIRAARLVSEARSRSAPHCTALTWLADEPRNCRAGEQLDQMKPSAAATTATHSTERQCRSLGAAACSLDPLQ